MKKLKFLLVILVLFLFESTVMSSFPIFGATLPLSFTFALVISIYEDRWDALMVGLFCGFLHDMYSPYLFGLNMLLDMWFMVMAGKGARYLRRENPFLMAVFGGITSLLRYLIQYFIMSLTGKVALLPSVGILSLLVLLLTYPMILLYNRILQPRHKRKKYRY